MDEIEETCKPHGFASCHKLIIVRYLIDYHMSYYAHMLSFKQNTNHKAEEAKSKNSENFMRSIHIQQETSYPNPKLWKLGKRQQKRKNPLQPKVAHGLHQSHTRPAAAEKMGDLDFIWF